MIRTARYGGRHQKSCTALVVALTLLSEDSPIMGDLLDPRTRCRERIDGTWRSLLGMIRAMSPMKWGSRRVQIRSSSKHIMQVTLWTGQYPTAGPCPWHVQDFWCRPPYWLLISGFAFVLRHFEVEAEAESIEFQPSLGRCGF